MLNDRRCSMTRVIQGQLPEVGQFNLEIRLEPWLGLWLWVDKKGKILTGNHRFSHDLWDFPVIFDNFGKTDSPETIDFPMKII